MAIENVNKATINLYCTSLKKLKCKARLSLTLANCDADCSTNWSESINRTLNENCPPLRKPEKFFVRIHNHKFKMLGKRIARVNQNRLGNNKRRRIVTERFEKLEDLVTNYSTLTAVQKTDKLFTYL